MVTRVTHYRFAIAFLICAAFAVYWNALPAPFTFDDEHAIVSNEQIRQISTSLGSTTQGSPLAGRPIVSLTFALNYAFGGLDVRGYRMVNIAIHALCGVLLFVIAARTLRTRGERAATGVAFAIAAIWLLHPLATEPVDYVSQRTELMLAAFLLLTLWVGTGTSSRTREAVSAGCCALGMACKETMVVAPVIVFLYDRTFVFGSFGRALRERWQYYAALSSTWLVLIALLRDAPRGDSAGFATASVSPWTYLLNESVMIVRYLRLAVWPRGLVLDYGEPLPLTLADVWPYAAAVLALLVMTLIALVRRPAAGFLGAWFFLTLAPTSSFVPISTEVGAERRMYLPLMAGVAWGIVSVHRFMGSQVHRFRGSRVRGFAGSHPRTSEPVHPCTREPVNLVLFTAFLLFLAFSTVQRNAEYRSGVTLWQSVLDRWPPHARAHRNLAAELKLAGRSDEEIVHLQAAVADLPEIRNLLGIELLSVGRHEEAARELEKYTGDHPADADALSNLGIALAALGRDGEATTAFERAIAVDPANGLSQRNLALHLLEHNDFDRALGHAREAVRLTPRDPEAHNLLGLALAAQQHFEEAIGEFRESLALQPTGNEASGYLARTLNAMGR